MADVTLLVENCIACVLFIWGTFFLVNVACRYNKPDSELSVVAERIRKEAQDHIILITSQCAFCKVVFSYFVPLTLASGRPEVVAKKFNIKMAKVTLRIAPDLFVLFHGCPRTFFFHICASSLSQCSGCEKIRPSRSCNCYSRCSNAVCEKCPLATQVQRKQPHKRSAGGKKRWCSAGTGHKVNFPVVLGSQKHWERSDKPLLDAGNASS